MQWFNVLFFACFAIVLRVRPSTTFCWGFGYDVNAPENSWGSIWDYSYPSGRSCNWFLKAKNSGQRVALYFETFNLPGGQSCTLDYIEVRDAKSTHFFGGSNLLGKFCGSTRPPYFVSSGQYLSVHFVSQTNRQPANGYLMKFKTVDKDITNYGPSVCNIGRPYAENQNLRLTADSGTLSSPNYPSNYNWLMRCTWVITVATGKTIKLSSTDMNVDGGYDGTCSGYDHVTVHNGPSVGSREIGTYCGTTGFSVSSSSNTFLVRFESNNVTQAKGFKLQYEAVGLSTAVLAGIIVGVLAVVIIIIIVIAYLTCSNKKPSQVQNDPTNGPNNAFTTGGPPPPYLGGLTNTTGVSVVNAAPPPYMAQPNFVTYRTQTTPTRVYGNQAGGPVMYGNQVGVPVVYTPFVIQTT